MFDRCYTSEYEKSFGWILEKRGLNNKDVEFRKYTSKNGGD